MQNQTIIQFFHWYYNEEQNLWTKVAAEAAHLKEIGVTMAWLPPAYKSNNAAYDVGYAVYDLFDLGEFDQKVQLTPSMAIKMSTLMLLMPCTIMELVRLLILFLTTRLVVMNWKRLRLEL